MFVFAARSRDFISPLALIATCAKVAISENVTKVAGDGAHPVLTACGLRTSCVVHEAMTLA
jgi:hypothetical protein